MIQIKVMEGKFVAKFKLNQISHARNIGTRFYDLSPPSRTLIFAIF